MNTILLFSLAAMFPGQSEQRLVDAPVVDRGGVKAGKPLSQTFRLHNRTTLPLTIDEVAVGCGCLKPRVSRMAIPAGESAELVIDVNTLSQASGPNSWKTVVRYHGDKPGEQELRINATIVREITIEPVALALTLTKEASHTITVTDSRYKPLRVASATCSSKHVKVDLPDARSGANGARIQEIEVKILESFPVGESSETLIIKTDDDEYKHLQVPILVTKKSPDLAIASPAELDLRLAKGQDEVRGVVSITRGRPIGRVESDHAAVKAVYLATTSSGFGAASHLAITIAAGKDDRKGSATVKIHLSDPPQVLVIPVTWGE